MFKILFYFKVKEKQNQRVLMKKNVWSSVLHTCEQTSFPDRFPFVFICQSWCYPLWFVLLLNQVTGHLSHCCAKRLDPGHCLSHSEPRSSWYRFQHTLSASPEYLSRPVNEGVTGCLERPVYVREEKWSESQRIIHWLLGLQGLTSPLIKIKSSQRT